MAEEPAAALPDENGSPSAVLPHLREYQKEMYERSLQGNTIVSLDTGSGKTMVAIYRIMDVLERGSPNKIAWFLTPTVELCNQQHKVIRQLIPLATTACLVGEDGVDLWGSEDVWNEALRGVHVVVSTYAVLYDALAHSFVKLERLALLIVDEAHHCTKNHPINKIMRDSYAHQHAKNGPADLPVLLGLTASPAKTWNDNAIPVLETNMRSTCVTPRLHRENLRECVHRPTLTRIEHPVFSFETEQIVKSVYRGPLSENEAQVERILNDHETHATFSLVVGRDDEVKKMKREKLAELRRKLRGNVEHILDNLGSGPAADYLGSIARVQRSKQDENVGAATTTSQSLQLLYAPLLAGLMRELRGVLHVATDIRRLSTKVELLIDHLCRLYDPNFSALIFVKRRVVTTLLTKILETHERTKELFRAGAVVGTSNYAGRSRDISECMIDASRNTVLHEFRSGHKNVVITTDALEEGIDVAECNLVVCFDPPENLKSFIQRRGRARQRKSTYTVLVPKHSAKYSLGSWETLEHKMDEAIQKSEDEAKVQLQMENTVESVSDMIRVEKTGAFMAAENAKSHIYHFCRKLPNIPYSLSVPCFSFEELSPQEIRATVTLPVSVPAAARRAKGRQFWRTEAAAMKDAALQSIRLLHSYGLLTDNLLPLEVKPVPIEAFEKLKGASRELSSQYSPWLQDIQSANQSTLYRTIISFTGDNPNEKAVDIAIWTRFDMSNLLPITLTLENAVMLARFGTSELYQNVDTSILKSTTEMVIHAARSTVDASPAQDFVAFFTPDLPLDRLPEWIEAYSGSFKATEEETRAFNRDTLIQNPFRGGSLHILRNRAESSRKCDSQVAIECVQFPRKRKFLQSKDWVENNLRKKGAGTAADGKPIHFNLEQCLFRRLPIEYAWTSRLIPSLLYRLEVIMTGMQLRKTLLTSVDFGGIENLVAAITSPVTGMLPDYERLEFLGDTILKFISSCHVYNEHPNWHEGNLTNKRHSMISNVPLAKVGITLGLDRFILHNTFKAKHWRVPSVSSLEQDAMAPRCLSLKNIADVVEALIGAAFVTGGLENAVQCILELGLIDETPNMQTSVGISVSAPDACTTTSLVVSSAENLLKYQFTHKFLALEALTHPSYTRDATSEPYQRLEFLGDAVLDMLICTELHSQAKDASPGVLTKIKAALVNADFLAFVCLDLQDTVTYSKTVVSETKSIHQTTETRPRSLWMCMRTDATREVSSVRNETAARFHDLEEEIKQSMQEKRVYPWTLFASLNAPKFFSDIIESTLGAVFVDSCSSLEECRKVAGHLGLVDYLQTFCKPGFDVTHPKDRLQSMVKGKLTYQRETDPPSSNLFSTRVLENDMVIGSASSCKTRAEAVLKACEAAIHLLKSSYPVA